MIVVGARGRLEVYNQTTPNLSSVHVDGVFEDLANNITIPTDTYNLLDFPNEDGWRPELIERLADDVFGFKTTFMFGTGMQKKRPNPDPVKKALTEAGLSTRQDLTPDMIQHMQIMDTAGPQVRENDIQRSRRWCLASGHTFFTYPHYDAAGFCTWSMVTTGTKVWSYLRPDLGDNTSTREASKIILRLVKASITTESVEAPEAIPKVATPHNLFLTPGTLL